MTDRVHELLNFWFGNLGSADLPNSDRTNLWFGENDSVKAQILRSFNQEFESAVGGSLHVWADTPRGRLALIFCSINFLVMFIVNHQKHLRMIMKRKNCVWKDCAIKWIIL